MQASDHAQMPLSEIVCMEQFQAESENGYSTTGDITGETTCVVQCVAGAKMKGINTCRPVSCGRPVDRVGATFTPAASPTNIVFRETAKWTCKEGFSANGAVEGETPFERICQASGEFGADVVTDCKAADEAPAIKAMKAKAARTADDAPAIRSVKVVVSLGLPTTKGEHFAYSCEGI